MTPVTELVSQDQLKQEIAPVIQRAQSITITDQASYDFAIDFLKEIKGATSRIGKVFEKMKKQAYDSWKGIVATEDQFLDPLKKAEVEVKTKALTYQREQEAKREAERRRLQAEADEAARKERERLLKKAEKLKTAEKREALIEEAAEIAAPIIEAPATIDKAEGVATRKTWKARIIDEAAVPREYCIPNIKALDALAKSMKGKMKIAGVEFYCEESLAVGRN